MNRIIEIIKNIDNFIDEKAKILDSKKVSVPINIVGAVIFIVVSIVFLSLVPTQVKVNTDATITARTFPILMLRIVLIFSIILLIKDVVYLVQKKEVEKKEFSLLVEVRFLILFVMLVIYLVLLYLTSFVVSSVVFGILMLFYFRSKKISNYIIVILAAILIGYLFQNVLNVRLP